MDTQSLIKDSKARFSHNSAKAYLKEKYKAKLIIAEQGGLWEITPTLLTFLAESNSNTFVMLDLYENPIKIDRTDLLTKATTVYNEVMEAWHQEWKELENKLEASGWIKSRRGTWSNAQSNNEIRMRGYNLQYIFREEE